MQREVGKYGSGGEGEFSIWHRFYEGLLPPLRSFLGGPPLHFYVPLFLSTLPWQHANFLNGDIFRLSSLRKAYFFYRREFCMPTAFSIFVASELALKTVIFRSQRAERKTKGETGSAKTAKDNTPVAPPPFLLFLLGLITLAL